MKNSYSKTTSFILLSGMVLLLGCETGTRNKGPVDGNGVDSGIVSQNSNYKPHTPKDSEMNKIFQVHLDTIFKWAILKHKSPMRILLTV